MPREYRSTGPLVAEWIEEYCVHTEGDYEGEPFRLTEPQRGILNRIFEQERTEDGRGWKRRYSRVLLGLASGSGKTELVAALAHHQAQHRRAPIIPIAAGSKEQAGHLFGAAKFMCQEPEFPLFHLCEAGVDAITMRGRPGRIYRVSAMEGTNEGQRPSDFFADELHIWPETRNTFGVISKGTAKRAESLQVYISTAGYDLDTICGRLYEHGKRVNSGEVQDPHFLMLWIEAPEEVGIDEFERYREWHIGVDGGFLTLDNLREQRRELIEPLFRRYFRNSWVDQETAWLPSGVWDACAVDPAELVFDEPDERGLHAGWDASTGRDSTAVAWARWATDREGKRRIFVDGSIWERPIVPLTGKPDERWRIPRAEIQGEVVALAEKGPVTAIQYDRMFITWVVEDLESAGLPMREFAQSGVKMTQAAQELYNLIIEGVLAHAGKPEQARHVRNAVARQVRTGSGAWRLEKGRAKKPMDWVIAVAMAVWSLRYAVEEDEAVEAHMEVAG